MEVTAWRAGPVASRRAWPGGARCSWAGLSGCAASQDTSVSDPARHVSFIVPGGWRPIGAAPLTAELKSTIGNSGAWTVAYEAGPRPKATDFLSFGVAQPFRLRRLRRAQHHRERWDVRRRAARHPLSRHRRREAEGGRPEVPAY